MINLSGASIALFAVLIASGGSKTVSGQERAQQHRPNTAAAKFLEPEAAAIGRYLRGMESLGFSGAAIAQKDGKLILREGYGLADRETRRPYLPTTVQSHGSITKQITGAAIVLLEQQGKLGFDDPIGLFFEGVPKDKSAITIHHLLTHYSGLPSVIGSDEEPVDSETFLAAAMAAELSSEPGQEYSYSNVGYSLLGIIVEKVSKRDYETFLREELLKHTGLADTGYILPQWNEERLASGYRHGAYWGQVFGRGWLPDGPGWHLRANGGLHTTADDMAQWMTLLRGEGVLTPVSAANWTTGKYDEPGGTARSAYGWVDHETPWGRMVAHAGSNGIFSADFVWFPDRDLFFYLQGNSSVVPARGQRARLLSALFNADFNMPPLIDADPDADPLDASGRVGDYFLENGRIELTSDDIRLVAKPWGQQSLDTLFKHDADDRAFASSLNDRTRLALAALERGENDALGTLLPDGADAIAPTAILLDRIAGLSRSKLQKLHVIGSFANAAGSRFEDLGPWTTFVYAEFDNWNQYWNIIWDDAGHYSGTARGPWPTFTLVPIAPGAYRAVLPDAPWTMASINFDGGCLLGEGLKACRQSPDPERSSQRLGRSSY